MEKQSAQLSLTPDIPQEVHPNADAATPSTEVKPDQPSDVPSTPLVVRPDVATLRAKMRRAKKSSFGFVSWILYWLFSPFNYLRNKTSNSQDKDALIAKLQNARWGDTRAVYGLLTELQEAKSLVKKLTGPTGKVIAVEQELCAHLTMAEEKCRSLSIQLMWPEDVQPPTTEGPPVQLMKPMQLVQPDNVRTMNMRMHEFGRWWRTGPFTVMDRYGVQSKWELMMSADGDAYLDNLNETAFHAGGKVTFMHATYTLAAWQINPGRSSCTGLMCMKDYSRKVGYTPSFEVTVKQDVHSVN